MSERWLSIVEYARNYNISDMTVRRRIKTGKLHAVLREGKYFIPINEGHQPFPAQTQAPEPPPPPKPIVKSRPKAKPVPQPSYQQFSDQEVLDVTAPKPVGERLPMQMQTEFLRQETISVDSRSLLSFCEHALDRVAKNENRIEREYRAKNEQLEALIKAKDIEISQLYQQVEDLQVLVKILEKKR